jgi:hypothetical protein
MSSASACFAGRWAGTTLVLAVVLGLLVGWAGDLEAKDTFPKTANVYFPYLSEADIDQLAKWDVLVLPKRAQSLHQEELARLRELNPDIVLLVHMPVAYHGGWMDPEDNAVLTNKLNGGDWWLGDVTGQTVMLNNIDGLTDVTAHCPADPEGKRLRDWLPEYIAERFGPGGWWDGAFLDCCWSRVSWMNNYAPNPIDVDRDGIADSNEKIDAAWDEGMRAMTERLRELVGDDYMIVSNGNNTYYDVCNGSTREDFPNMHGDWYHNITNQEHGYVAIDTKYRNPSMSIINTIWRGPSALGEPIRTAEFKRNFEFTFASTLIFGDGYYSLDGPSHCQTWWHEYYDLDLGRALGPGAKAVAVPGARPDVSNADMIHARRFEKGVATVNPTNCAQTIHLAGVYYPPESWNGSFYPCDASLMTLNLSAESGKVLVGSGRMIASSGGVTCTRIEGVNCVEWNAVGGASAYSVYRADVSSGGIQGSYVLVAVTEETFFDDASAKTSVSRYRVAAIDEIGCEGQWSCPVEVSSGLGSDLSLALVVIDESDGTLALSWSQGNLADGVVFHIGRTDATGVRDVMTEEPVDPSVASRWVDTDVVPGESYLYEAVAEIEGEEVVIGAAAGEVHDAAGTTRLRGCFPHPMVTSSTFSFDIGGDDRSGAVDAALVVYDVSGRVVRRLLDEPVAPGSHTVVWDGRTDEGSKVASGCYFYALEAGEEFRSGKVLVVR